MAGSNFRLKPNGFAINLLEVKEPRFSELQRVQVNDGENPPYEGYVVEVREKNDRWIYRISISDDPSVNESWDNWASEEWLTRTK